MCDFDLPFPTFQEVDEVDRLVEPLLIHNLQDEDHLIDDDEECTFEEIDEH